MRNLQRDPQLQEFLSHQVHQEDQRHQPHQCDQQVRSHHEDPLDLPFQGPQKVQVVQRYPGNSKVGMAAKCVVKKLY